MGNLYLAARAAESNCGDSSAGAGGMSVAVAMGLAINGGSGLAFGELPPQLASTKAISTRVTVLQIIVQFGMASIPVRDHLPPNQAFSYKFSV